MGLLSSLFDPPETRRHRTAAMAAVQLREQAARDVHIELQVLVPFFRAAAARQQRAVAEGDLELAGRCASALEAADELVTRVERVGPQLQADIHARRSAAASASDWERYATFELDLREGFLQMREQVKEHTRELQRLQRMS